MIKYLHLRHVVLFSSVYLQEKELISKHNEWLNDELTEKVNSLIELRRTQMEYEAESSAKISNVWVSC